MLKKIVVSLGNRSYPIVIAEDRFRSLGPLLKTMGLGDSLFVVAAPDVKKRYGRLLQECLKRSGIHASFPKHPFPSGRASEKAKSQKWVDSLVQELVRESREGKGVVLAAFSGGVLGDLTGYVASIYKRGIPYIQIPTTLLAQVDSAIGGKVGIDLPEGKNLLGAIYQPRLVYSELTLLESLPKENLRDGLAEVAKYGVIADSGLFSFLEENHTKILPRSKHAKPNRQALRYIVTACSRIKAEVVRQDERDNKDIRIRLNFGHTLGHAIEQAKGYQEKHGRAISVGMICAAEIANRLGLCGNETVQRIETLLKKLGLPVHMKGISQDKLFHAESLDKKFIHGKNRYVLPLRIGKVVVREDIPYPLIRAVVSRRIVP